MPPVIVHYVSGHGFGHAARQQAVIRELARRGAQVHVRSSAPAKFFASATSHHAYAYDIGLIQPAPLLMDAPATARWYADFLERQPALIQQELAFIRQVGATLIACDMPPIACEIAQSAGLPCVVLTHFTWDWVYEHYVERVPEFVPLIASIRASYGKATLALEMPFAHDFSHFPRVEALGLVVNPATQTPAQTRQQWATPPEARVALVSMGGHGWRGDARRLADFGEWVFWVMPHLWEQVSHLPNCRLIPTDTPDYQNLIAAADVVIGKAGGSTVAEVVAHQPAMLYTLNDDWRENELLSAALERYARVRYIPRADFEQGAWLDLLDAVLEQAPPREQVRTDGASVAAERLVELG